MYVCIVGTHFPAQDDAKTTLVILPDSGETSWLLLPSSSSYYQATQCHQNNLFLYFQSQVWEIQKRISININDISLSQLHMIR